ncbi:MAG: hypothetical protein AABZ26_02540, partial [Chloroflexota bacterium]
FLDDARYVDYDEAGNVVGLMPHPERCAEEILGGTDGRRVLESLVRSVGTRSAELVGLRQ